MSPKNREGKAGKRQSASLLDKILERRMGLYVLAVGAALASAPETQAKVVFTPSNAVLTFGTLPIDLNNDGTVDFTLNATGGFTSYVWSYASSVNGAVASNVILQDPNGGPAALKKGAAIGNPRTFVNGPLTMRFAWIFFPDGLKRGGEIGSPRTLENRASKLRHRGNFGPYSSSGGNFIWSSNAFLGVRFMINGEPHYGWIGFRSVTNHAATLTGWAYETRPNQFIRAGDKMGNESDLESGTVLDSAAPRAAEPTSLELLAAGNVAMTDWRRRRAS